MTNFYLVNSPPHDFKDTNRVPSPQNVVAVLPENSKKNNNKSGRLPSTFLSFHGL